MWLEGANNYELPGWIESNSFIENVTFNDSINLIQSRALQYLEQEKSGGRDTQELENQLSELVEKQSSELSEFKDSIIEESQDLIDKEKTINSAKENMYELCGISENMSENSWFENFSKGFIDEALIWNWEMAIEVINTKWAILIDALKQLASWEWLKMMAEALGESVMNLFSWDAYATWKSVAELWLITTGIAAVWVVWKKGMKMSLKQSVKSIDVVDSQGLKNIIESTSSKVDSIIPVEKFNFERSQVESIAKLDKNERLQAAEWLLGTSLSDIQQEAIMKAHKVGETNPESWVFNYNFWEKKEKLQILTEAWFSLDQRKTLLESGITGRLIENYKNLYEKYDFLQNPEYDRLRGMLEEANRDVEYFGEGVNGFVIGHPMDEQKVIKIWKPGGHDINLEYEMHNDIVLSLNKMHENHLLDPDTKIRIPEVYKQMWENFFEMERVVWQTYKTEFYLTKYADELDELDYDFDYLSELTDSEVELVLDKHKLTKLPEPNTMAHSELSNLLDAEYTEWWDEFYETAEFEEVRTVTELIGFWNMDGAWKELMIIDRNPGNIMKGRDGEIYLIDFGL